MEVVKVEVLDGQHLVLGAYQEVDDRYKWNEV
jgi:hypothetical protein